MQTGSIKKNFIMNAILTLSSFIIPIITFPYVSRILGPAGTGKVAFATSFVTYFNTFAQLGIPTYGVRATAQVRDDRLELTRVTHELLIINLVTSAVAYIALGASILFSQRIYEDRELILLVSSLILLSAIGVEWLYRGLEQYAYITVRSLVFKVIAIVGMFLLVKSEDDYLMYGGVSIFASSASFVMNFFHARKYVSFKPVGGYKFRRHLNAVMVFFAMSCATTIYTNLDSVMLGFMSTDAEVGYYNAAVKVKNILVSMVTALGAVLLPRSSYYVENGQMEQFYDVSKKALRFVLAAAAPLSLFFALFAHEGIMFLSGPLYNDAGLPMQIVMPTVLLIGLTNILGIQMLVPIGRERVVLKSEVFGAIADLILNAMLIPTYKATGAAVGTLVAEIVVLAVQYVELRDMVRDFFRRYGWGRLMTGLIIATLSCYWTKSLGLQSYWTLACAGTIFFGVYYLFMLIRKEEIALEVKGIVLRGVERLGRRRQT